MTIHFTLRFVAFSFSSLAFGAAPQLRDPGPTSGTSVALAVSQDGKTVGGELNGFYASRWTEATGMLSLGTLGGSASSYARGVSGDGSVIVGEGSASERAAFRWTQTTGMVNLGTLAGGTWAQAYGVSADGQTIVGNGNSSGGLQAFRWTPAQGYTALGYLPGGSGFSIGMGASANGSVIVGASSSTNATLGQEAFRWTQSGGMSGLGDLPGGAFSSGARASSADGSIIVGFGTSAAGTSAFRWTQAGGMVDLGSLGGSSYYSYARGVSANGSVVVGEANSATGMQAFIWDATHGMRSLREVLSGLGLNMTGWTLGFAYGISGDGLTIVGFGTNPQGVARGWMATIPEPNTAMFLMFSLGFASAGPRTRRRVRCADGG